MTAPLRKADVLLGMVCATAAVFMLFVWIPLDTETGLVEKVRGRQSIGDGLAPSIAASLLLLSGTLLAIQGLIRTSSTRLSSANLIHVLKILIIITVAIAIMRWTGPLLVSLFADGATYRQLRASFPWHWSGYVVGGTVMVAALIRLARGKLDFRIWGIALVASIALASFYDLPFDDLLLPPNGDV